ARGGGAHRMAAEPAAHRGNIIGEWAMTISSFVAVRSVSKTYGRGQNTVEALQEVSFEVRQGEFAHLVGPSGSGKSTLINLLDEERTQSVMDLLYRSCQGRGKTLILVTHDRHSRQPADIVFALRKGSLTRVLGHCEAETASAPGGCQTRGLRV